MSKANFSINGINLGGHNTSLTYLYGLADFWVDTFESSDVVDTLMESETLLLSETYSKFLQLTSMFSLNDVQTTFDTQLKLVLVKDTDVVKSEINTYKVPSNITKSSYLANRPFLPTALLENEVHYRIESGKIKFFSPIDSFGFPVRSLKDGSKQYAIWFVDAKLDYNWISDNYAKFINLSTKPSTDKFKELVQGIFFLYSHGPILSYISRGMNLVLGIPVSRDKEKVIEILKLAESDLWTVVTDSNSYLIPYGLSPTVEIGDDLEIGQELSSWVEIKDYVKDGDWWLNLYIPEEVMPAIPEGQPNRFATRGSYADQVMRGFLKTHTFLVNVKVSEFKNIQVFEDIYDILKQVKPAYTFPIYVWTVPNEEVLELHESLDIGVGHLSCESVLVDGTNFNRYSSEYKRGCPQFLRFMAPSWVDEWMGKSEHINGKPRLINGGTMYGYIAPQLLYREPTLKETAWTHLFWRRDNAKSLKSRGLVSKTRAWDRSVIAVTSESASGSSVEVTTVSNYASGTSGGDFSTQWLVNPVLDPITNLPYRNLPGTPVKVDYFSSDSSSNGLDLINARMFNDTRVSSAETLISGNVYRLVPLYITTEYDLRSKLTQIGFKVESGSLEDKFLIPNGYVSSSWDLLKVRGENAGYLGKEIPQSGYQNFSEDIAGVEADDHILCTRISELSYGVFLYTKGVKDSPTYLSVKSTDPILLTFDKVMDRSGSRWSTPAYFTRASSQVSVYPSAGSTSINDGAIGSGSTTDISPDYSDVVNTNVKLVRSGTSLVHIKETQ